MSRRTGHTGAKKTMIDKGDRDVIHRAAIRPFRAPHCVHQACRFLVDISAEAVDGSQCGNDHFARRERTPMLPRRFASPIPGA